MSPLKDDLVWKLLEESVKKVKGDIEKHSTRNMGGGASVFSAAPNQSTKRKRQDNSIQEREVHIKRLQKESPSAEDELTKGLVFNYLKLRLPTLQEEFKTNFTFTPTQLHLEEVITVLKSSAPTFKGPVKPRLDRVEKTDSEDSLTKGLVYNYLQKTTANLAEEFKPLFSNIMHTQLQLAEVLEYFEMTKDCRSGRTKLKSSGRSTVIKGSTGGRRNRPTGFNIRRFSLAEDEVIREVMTNTKGKIDFNALAKRLDRGFRSIQNRIESLKLNGGIHKYKNYSLSEDYLILDTLIIPRLKQEKLSRIVLSNCHYEKLAMELKRRLHSVRNRWQGSIQPCLLKHYAGTLNLEVEKMLANHIADTYTDFSEINWPTVAALPDFAGHTEHSLKNMYFQVLMKSTKKALERNNHVTLAEIAKHTMENKPAWKVNKDKWQQPLISYFQKRINEMGIRDFL